MELAFHNGGYVSIGLKHCLNTTKILLYSFLFNISNFHTIIQRRFQLESTLLKTVGYVRNSTPNQMKAGTIEIQKKEIVDFSSKADLQIVKIFEDTGISGTVQLAQRSGFLELINFIEKNKDVQILVVYSLDRIARDLMIQEQFISLMNKANIKILSIREPDLFEKDATRIFIRQILGAAAEFEKSLITTRMSAGRLRKIKDGFYAGGKIPFGYSRKQNDKTKSDLEIEPDHIQNIQKIFELRSARNSYRQIIKVLNDEGIKPPHGQKWYPATVRYICLNSVYQGQLKYAGISSERNDLAIIS